MKEPKLISLLKSFSKVEFKELDKFISSSYHNNGRNLKPLYTILKKNYPEFNIEKITGRKAYEKLYGKTKTFSKKESLKLRVIYSLFTNAVEEYLVIKKVKENKSIKTKLLVDELYNRHLHKLCEFESDYYEKLVNDNSDELNYCDEKIWISTVKLNNRMISNMNSNAIELYRYTMLYSLSRFFGEIRPLLMMKNNFGKNDSSPSTVIKGILKGFDPENFEKVCDDDGTGIKNILMINYKFCTLFFDDDPDKYREILEYYQLSFRNLSHFYKWNIFTALFNMGYKKAHRINYKLFAEPLCKLGRFVLGENITPPDNKGYIYASAFEMIINIQFGIAPPVEFKKFAEDNIKKIKKSQLNFLDKYILAMIKFKYGEFTECLNIISKLNSTIITQKNFLQRLKIACYIELGYIDSAEDAIDSYRHFINNNKNVNNVIRNNGKDFAECCKKLIKYIENGNDNPGYEYIEYIRLKNTTHFTNWFMDKLSKKES